MCVWCSFFVFFFDRIKLWDMTVSIASFLFVVVISIVDKISRLFYYINVYVIKWAFLFFLFVFLYIFLSFFFFFRFLSIFLVVLLSGFDLSFYDVIFFSAKKKITVRSLSFVSVCLSISSALSPFLLNRHTHTRSDAHKHSLTLLCAFSRACSSVFGLPIYIYICALVLFILFRLCVTIEMSFYFLSLLVCENDDSLFNIRLNF